MVAAPQKADSLSQQELISAQAAQINPHLFVKVLSRIVRVIKYNFLEDLKREASPGKPYNGPDSEEDSLAYLKQLQTMVNRELLQQLTASHANSQPPLGFNSLAKVAADGYLTTNLPDKKETGR
jgi:hypothetical protein